MALIQELKAAQTLTERETDIRDYFLGHPELIMNMSCHDLGQATFTSAATVTRFCKKFGCKGYPEFKLRFLNEIAAGRTAEETSSVQLSERENMVTLLRKVSDVQAQALEVTRKALSLSQLLRIQQILLEHPYIDFYAYDTNLQLARYASSLLFHAGKTAATYSETNIQVLSTLAAQPGHLAILISHTGENTRLIELARLLRRNGTRRIVITSGKETTLGRMADEFLYAPTALGMDRMWSSTFFTAAKYLLDLMYAIVFCGEYNSNMALNQRYETIGAAAFWGLNSGE